MKSNINNMKTTKSKIVIIIIFIILIFTTVYIIYPKKISITEYLEDGVSVIYTLRGIGTQLNITINSKNETMYTKIIVDNKIIHEQNNIYNLNITKDIGLGDHTINIIVQNQRMFGSGDIININGTASINVIFYDSSHIRAYM